MTIRGLLVPRETSEALLHSPLNQKLRPQLTLTGPRPVMRAVKARRSSSHPARLRVWCLPSRSICGTAATECLLMVYFFERKRAAKGSP